MVDFRYHLVSIIAIFLALALGIVVGTTALNGPIQDNLNNNIGRLSEDKRSLEETVGEQRAQLGAADELVQALGPALVRGDLTDRGVLLVTTPDTPADLAEQLVPLLTAAGAEVTGTLTVLPALWAPESAQLVEDLVAGVLPAGVELPDGEPVERATAELAAALVRGSDGDGIEAAEAQAVVSAFEEADLVQFSPAGDILEQATLAVLLVGPAPAAELDDAEQAERAALLGLAGELDDRGDGAVLAGASGSAGDRGAVRALRDDDGLARDVSTVDNADRGTGQVATVLALAEQLEGETGQYGAGTGAAGALPTPRPAASPAS